jgi:glutamate-5-semialdehyde dehydrogenase
MATSKKTFRSEICAKRANEASSDLAMLSPALKNKALLAMAKALSKNADSVISANQIDIKNARGNKMPAPMLARLALDNAKVHKIADSIAKIALLPDPVGRLISQTKRPNGLVIKKVGVPIGVILIIYESRPNVTADCMALCLKSGNSVILRGGSEAFYSNKAIFNILSQAAIKAGVAKGAFEFVSDTQRSTVEELLKLSQWIHLVIPRGGEGLIRRVTEISKIPVIKHYKGVCHVFVDESADFNKSINVVVNAKTQNPSVCNAMETLLVHKKIAASFLPKIAASLKAKHVELRGDAETRKIIKGVKVATENDWHTEYLDLILSVRVVSDVHDAVKHIRKYGSEHSDAIMTKNKANADHFCQAVSSACVFVNTSTRFNDGGEFGMGAEMGISTDKLHARGPMGLEELTTYKYIVTGDGQIRS